MAAQPPKPPAFCISMFFRGHSTDVTPDLVCDLARAGLTPDSIDLLTLAGEQLGFDLGDLVAAALDALGLDTPPLQDAAESARALVQNHHAHLNRRTWP